MISVKVLGTGCKKCQNLENKVKELVASNNIDATVEKVTDIFYNQFQVFLLKSFSFAF